MSLEKYFAEYNKSHQLFHLNQKIVLCASGGIDSTVLLDLLVKTQVVFCVVHVNYCLRKKDSDEDEMFLKTLTSKHQIPFYSTKHDLSQSSEIHSIQEEARNMRYAFAEKIRQDNGYHLIATAHHADDAVETFFFNLFRGSGIHGLSGIPVKNKHLIRPLLFASKQDIIEYAEKNNMAYRTDKSNEEKKYSRNIIRHDILPNIYSSFSAFKVSAKATLQNINEATQALNDYFQLLEKKILIKKSEDVIAFHFKKLEKMKAYKSLLIHALLSRYDILPSQIPDLLNLFKSQKGKKILTKSYLFYKDKKVILIFPIAITEDHSPSILVYDVLPNKIDLGKSGEIEVRSFKYQKGKVNLHVNKNEALLDESKLQFPLVMRKKKDGDYFYPLGLEKKKKIKKLFSDVKMNDFEKSNQYVLESGEKIAWVVNQAMDYRFQITAKTERFVRLTFKPKH